jgi:REP element-mobilizing transposase RayT
MPRTARIAPNEYVYHILTRGNNRQDIFKDKKDYKKFMEVLQRYKEKYRFRLYLCFSLTNLKTLLIKRRPNLSGLRFSASSPARYSEIPVCLLHGLAG